MIQDRAGSAAVTAGPPRLVGFWPVLATCFGLLILRGQERLVHADLFAEGVRFVGLALNDGWSTLLAPYDMFFHTAPKLVALLAVSTVPMAALPLVTNLACVAISAAAMASVARPAWRWLIPSDGARVLLALLMTLAPGLVEVYGNLAGLHWSLLIWLAVLSLKDPDQPFSIWELGLVALVVLTSGGAVVFLSVAGVRLWLAWRAGAPAQAGQRWRRELAFFGILALAALWLFAHFILQQGQVGSAQDELDLVVAARDLDELLPHLGALFTTFYFLHPFLGTHNTSLFLLWAPFYPLVATAVVMVLLALARLLRHRDPRLWLLPAWLAALLGFAVMLSIVRYWAFYGIFSYPYDDWWFRYNFLFASTGLLFWGILIRAKNLRNLGLCSTAVMLLLAGAYFFQARMVTSRAAPPHHTEAWAIPRYADTNYWAQSAARLQRARSTGCPARVEVRGAPHGKWTFVYESGRSPAECSGD